MTGPGRLCYHGPDTTEGLMARRTTRSAAAEAAAMAPTGADGPSRALAVPPVAPRPEVPPDPYAAEGDPFEARASFEMIDRMVNAATGRSTSGLSPRAVSATALEWWLHLATAPGKQLELADKARRKWLRLMAHAARGGFLDPEAGPCIAPLPQDRRFSDPAWSKPPFNLWYQAFLLQQQWWHNATTGVPGVARPRERSIEFITRQLLDIASPSNFLWTNPEALSKTWEEGGQNLMRGLAHFMEDLDRTVQRRPAPADAEFEVGRTLAATPGAVVYRNALMELIQYAPTTAEVRPEPVVIVPAWIMKYYILDLTPESSLIRHLTGQGYTVFVISWKNPDPSDRERGMDDYRRLGPLAAFDAVQAITGSERMHAVGYCLGGTLLLIAAAAMARDGDMRLATVSLFAAQGDFSEAGELSLFISESEVRFLEDIMWEQGFLDSRQMAGAFQLLRSNDLVWSKAVRTYLMGERAPGNAMTAWNADATRMPYKMHAEYLRQLFLENRLANAKFEVGERPVSIRDIEAPFFAVGTETDHIAPWRSVYKIHLLADTDVSFVLTNGGHNHGVVAAPGPSWRHYRIHHATATDRYLAPEAWAERAEVVQGSWWPAWIDWLGARSGEPVAPPPLGAPEHGYPPLGPAPGSYVLMK
jgi:polyhydroxyalkanoate synthase subunit PhaC